MREVASDLFYEIINEYNRLEVDYCLIENNALYNGYSSHKEAVLYAMQRLNEQYPWISIDSNKAIARKITAEELFYVPDKSCEMNSPSPNKGSIPYWYAFLKPPHGTGPVIHNGKIIRKKYSKEDFDIVNRTLFPQGLNELEIYEWSNDWSNYFDAGLEWWGTICCSIFDKKMNRYVVLMASSTD